MFMCFLLGSLSLVRLRTSYLYLKCLLTNLSIEVCFFSINVFSEQFLVFGFIFMFCIVIVLGALNYKMTHFALLEYSTYFTLFIAIFLGFVIASALLLVSFFLAVRTPDSEKTSSYECGFEPFEDARNRFDVRFYIVAILFIIFDLEVAFLFPWAKTITFTGFCGYSIAGLFLLVLTIGFVYEVVKGALNSR